jgi:ribonuclease P protein component
MLPRSQRLSTAEFALAFQNGRILRHPLLQLRAYRRAQSTLSGGILRAAFVAPKKLGKAHVRNRVRRRVSEQFRLSPARAALMETASLNGFDLIFMASPAVQQATSAQIEEAIAQLLRRLASNRSPHHARRENSTAE